ncbi:MAG: Rqc2 family fibronectin-binding protein [Clostridia bacterium]|jgi:predicted ribosome quality control (RQC) complex YloA/Tae2 family protein
MPLDGIAIHAVVNELKKNLIGGRIDKIHQPERDEIILSVRNQDRNYRLLMSASPNHARIHLASENKPNPIQAPMFCMLLRKHLMGGRILNIHQPHFERIVEVEVENLDELGNVSSKKLTIEMMGRHSNIILCSQDGRIIDSIKHVNEGMSRVRQVLPGLSYQLPPSQGKRDPLLLSNEELVQLLRTDDRNIALDKLISGLLTGVSRISAREMIYRWSHDQTDVYSASLSLEKIEALSQSILAFFALIKDGKYEPTLYLDDLGNPIDFFPFLYRQYPATLQKKFSSMSEILETFYSLRDKKDRIAHRSSHLYRLLQNNLERCDKKIAIQQETIQEAAQRDQYKLFGELITANLYQITKGSKAVQVQNYYKDPPEWITIPLNEHLSPSENAQHYYKLYAKAKRSFENAVIQLEEARQERAYLEGQLDNLNKCTEESEINEIRNELAREGYLKTRSVTKVNKNLPPSKPYRYISSDGFEIFVGKNNAQNDYLTLRFAKGDDLWLHTKDIPGSHVIIKLEGKPVSDVALQEGALLAAYYSKGRLSSKIPVDYTFGKYVKKPGGAKPGMVIYVNHMTIHVTPKDNEIGKIKRLD